MGDHAVEVFSDVHCDLTLLDTGISHGIVLDAENVVCDETDNRE